MQNVVQPSLYYLLPKFVITPDRKSVPFKQFSCILTLVLSCVPMDCSPPGSSVHGMFQARILEWVAVPFTRGDLPNPEIKSTSPVSSALQADSLLLSHQGRPHEAITHCHQFSPPPSPWQPPFYFLSI